MTRMTRMNTDGTPFLSVLIRVIRGCDHEANYHNSESLFD